MDSASKLPDSAQRVADLLKRIGHVKDTTLLVDQDLLRFDCIWAAAGHPHAVFSLSPQELLTMTGGQVVDVALSDSPHGAAV